MCNADAISLHDLRAQMKEIKQLFEERHESCGLVCKEGVYDGCCVIKLLKPEWTNDRMDQVRNTSGIFFSVWAKEKGAAHAEYNIHALKVRELNGYSITSREFAEEFRRKFEKKSRGWPHVQLDYGPLTLMQGWIAINPASFEEDVLGLMERFLKIAPLVDGMLKKRRRK